MPAVTNTSAEKQIANQFPTIRFFSVGHRTQSTTPLRDLQTLWEPWQIASNTTIDKDFSRYSHLFSTFSAVCWFFGRELSSQLSATGEVPVGLISNNWGGTKLEQWDPRSVLDSCNATAPYPGPIYELFFCSCHLHLAVRMFSKRSGSFFPLSLAFCLQLSSVAFIV